MNNMVAYCGLTCESCPIYLATLEEEKSLQHTLRESIAKQCNDLYAMNLQPEDISDCDGCRAYTGRIFSGCLNCEIRKCAAMKNVENCAFCTDYACSILEKHFLMDVQSKIRLEEIRAKN